MKEIKIVSSDEKVPEAIECANSFTDHFIKWNTKEEAS